MLKVNRNKLQKKQKYPQFWGQNRLECGVVAGFAVEILCG